MHSCERAPGLRAGQGRPWPLCRRPSSARAGEDKWIAVGQAPPSSNGAAVPAAVPEWLSDDDDNEPTVEDEHPEDQEEGVTHGGFAGVEEVRGTWSRAASYDMI